MLPSLAEALEQELAALAGADLLRSCTPFGTGDRVHPRLGTTPLVSFSSNDYLGLSTHPALARAAGDAAKEYGVGAAASRLVSGDLPPHRALESALAAFVGQPAALLFPSGYQANIGAITALASRDDLILSDASNHASLIDGCRLSRAHVVIYPHADAAAVRRLLLNTPGRHRRRVIVTESLFSMDGDIAPLADLAQVAREHDAVLVVDEAHALGCLGPAGRGVCHAAGVEPDVLVGTLGKAFGTAGGFVAGTEGLRALIVNRARTFIFTTAPPAPVAAAAGAAVALAAGAEGDERRRRLESNVTALGAALERVLPLFPAPIFPIPLGSERAALDASARLRERGLFVQAIRPPTVPRGTSRLRITVSAAHSEAEISQLAAAIHQLDLPRSRPPSAPRPALTRLPGLFVLGTDTSVGKTAVAASLLRIASRRGLRPVPLKPVETGCIEVPEDASSLLIASVNPALQPSDVCPRAFAPPVAPALAAELAGEQIELADLLDARDRASRHGDFLVVESAGGLLSPYAPHLTGADLAAAFGLPVVLIARNGLGTINHTALALSELRRRALPLAGLVLVDTMPADAPDRAHNARLIEQLTGERALGVLPFVEGLDPDRLADAFLASVDADALFAKSPRPRAASGR